MIISYNNLYLLRENLIFASLRVPSSRPFYIFADFAKFLDPIAKLFWNVNFQYDNFNAIDQ